jgi:hypothetical protein
MIQFCHANNLEKAVITTCSGIDKPIWVSGFELTRAMPETLQGSLPGRERIERELKGEA